MMAIERGTTGPGERVYAIGDVHGRLDLLCQLVSTIRQDCIYRRSTRTTIVQLGNLIDQGPASAELITKFMLFTARSSSVVVLKGRQEAMMADSLSGNLMLLGLWVQLGGDATLASWGIDPALITGRDLPALLRATRQVIPQDVVDWLRNLPLSYRSGDYLFTGSSDGPELEAPGSASIHRPGHDLISISSGSVESLSRNLVGRHRSRDLTSVGLEGEERWMVRTGGSEPPVGPMVAGARSQRQNTMAI